MYQKIKNSHHCAHTALPTRPHRCLIPAIRETHTHSPAYKTARMADRRSRKHTHTSLPTRPHRWPIAGQGNTHTLRALPTRSHGWPIAGQGNTHSPAYKTAQMADRWSGKHTHTHTALPTRPHRWRIADQFCLTGHQMYTTQ